MYPRHGCGRKANLKSDHLCSLYLSNPQGFWQKEFPIAISKLFDKSKQFVTFTSHGELSFYEISSHLKAMYTSPDIEYIRDTLWDLRDATLTALTTEEIRMIADIVRDHKDVRKSGKNAWVLPSDEDFGLGRMHEAQTMGLPVKTRAFRAMEEALQWLGQQK